VGPYATIAVFGATQWHAPVWLGLPVQWCGLVYADALYRLVGVDPKGPWKTLADGITLSGIEQTWPTNDAALQGLLPDSFALREQKRNGPAINPATVEACAARYYTQIPVYDFHAFKKSDIIVHVPGRFVRAEEAAKRVSFEIQNWVGHPYYVLVTGLAQQPDLEINGKRVECSSPHQFLQTAGELILRLEGNARVKLLL
jgi:hypothetical protein